MKRKWKIGDWCAIGELRYLVFDITELGDVRATPRSNPNSTILFHPDDIDLVALPDCTGWDWKPKPKVLIREGAYYALANNDIIGPMQDDRGTHWYCGADVWERDGTAVLIDSFQPATAKKSIVREVPKPEPVYRPFASSEEFEPHRDRWLLEKCGDKETRRFRIQIAAYNDAGIWLGGAQVATKYATALNLLAFEDGTPFGVEVAK